MFAEGFTEMLCVAAPVLQLYAEKPAAALNVMAWPPQAMAVAGRFGLGVATTVSETTSEAEQPFSSVARKV